MEFQSTLALNDKLKDLYVNASKNYAKEHGRGTTMPRWVLVRVNQFLMPEDYSFV